MLRLCFSERLISLMRGKGGGGWFRMQVTGIRCSAQRKREREWEWKDTFSRHDSPAKRKRIAPFERSNLTRLRTDPAFPIKGKSVHWFSRAYPARWARASRTITVCDTRPAKNQLSRCNVRVSPGYFCYGIFRLSRRLFRNTVHVKYGGR